MSGVETWIYAGLALAVGVAFLALVASLFHLASVKRRPAAAPAFAYGYGEDPEASAFVAIIDRHKVKGARRTLDKIVDHEALAFESRLAEALGPKGPQPSAK